MSTSTALIVISGTAAGLGFAFMYVTQAANRWFAQLVTGVFEGVRLTTKFRRLLLTQVWVAYVGGAVATGILGALLNVQYARVVEDSQVKTLCYVVAVVFGYMALDWVVKAVIWWSYARDLLREAAKHPD